MYQLVQWAFAGQAGHPALRAVIDRIGTHADRHFSADSDRDTLEGTGPGVWTDVMLAYAAEKRKQGEDLRKTGSDDIRFLPRIAYGYHENISLSTHMSGFVLGAPAYIDGMWVLHQFQRSWTLNEMKIVQ